ncbi:MAG: T9SS type A sorting domain-containing protein [candidate division Zixibacteria bacterium]|nr:T9SS type A sorting domain-containing protein [Candidatus Tariuqbacter arcticus]
MKPKLLCVIILSLIWAAAGMAYTWGPTYVTQIPEDIFRDSVILDPYGMDDPQPDTIIYDDGIGGYILHGPTNMWSDMRFTPVDSFELRAAYIMVQNPFSSSGQSAAVCFANNNGPPSQTVLAGPDYLPNPPASGTWHYVEFTTPVLFGPMEEFHIGYGPAPGGTYPTDPGWWPHVDESQTGGRPYSSSVTNPQQLPTSWTPMTYGDYMIRAGGEYLNPFTDMENLDCFTDNRMFFNLPGTDITLKVVVENVGMTDITTFTVHWDVQYDGITVFTADGAYGPVAQNQVLSCTSPDVWTPANVGMYEVTATITAPGDENTTNDIKQLEQYITDLDDMPYNYVTGSVTGNTNIGGWGISYNLPETPAKLDSFSILFNESGAADLSVLANDGFTGEPSTILWEFSTTVDTGVVMFYPANLVIFDEIFTISYLGDSPLSHDPTGINSADNDSMMNTAWSFSAGWEKMYSGDWPFIAYLDTSSALPPEPIIELSDSLITFGEVSVGDTGWYDVTVYNMGGSDPLVLTQLLFNPPPGIFGVSNFVPNTSIAAGDSFVLHSFFTPPDLGDYNNQMGIFNNATFPLPFIVPVSGTGVETGIADGKSGMPAKYELAQNMPNPFNPATIIEFALPTAGYVELVVYNVLGKEIARLVDGEMEAGYHSAQFNASNLSSGIYFYRLTAGDFTEMKKMVLMK